MNEENRGLRDFKFSTPPRCLEAEQKARREHLVAALGLDPYYMDEGVQQKGEQERLILRERLAAYAHEAWAGWMKHLCNRAGGNDDLRYSGRILLTSMDDAQRWARQMETPYAELPEVEKASDRAQADKILAILRGED